jgi:hypothetical protein
MIVGAGLSGLIAAHILPNHEIFEQGEKKAQHAALLRFRSSVVSDVTGIPFRRVTVHKGIWEDGEWKAPAINVSNAYAMKVVGQLVDRSIWNLEAVDRWIAPPDFYERMAENLGSRINWKCPIGVEDLVAKRDEGVISTIPMPVMLKLVGLGQSVEFRKSPVTVRKFIIPGADVHQTVYFPTSNHNLYRASLTGDRLICEFTHDAEECVTNWKEDVCEAFALHNCSVGNDGDVVAQEYGKILPIEDQARKNLIVNLTTVANVYSVGRFATWRNILLDDVVQDAHVVKRLLQADRYERKKFY